MHNMRTNRPDGLTEALQASDAALRSTFAACTGIALDGEQWKQVCLPFSKGGLGLRGGESHAAAAYLASRTSTKKLCTNLDAQFVWEGIADDGALEAARADYNSKVMPSAQLTVDSLAVDAPPLSQKHLATKIDEATQASLIEDSCESAKARLRATAAPHASAWLQAQPCEAMGQRMSHAEFVAALRVWLGSRTALNDGWCPKCDQVMDSKGAHALTCMAGGDAVRCHNSLRDSVFNFARSAGCRVLKEEIGLLPDDPRRRPGDLFFPEWPWGETLALDFAVTSPLQQGEVRGAALQALSAASSYESKKLADRSTAERCQRLGLRLEPMVVESFGGWGSRAKGVLKFLAQAKAAQSGETVSVVTRSLYSGLSIKLMRANARSLLARVAETGAHERALEAAAAHLVATASSVSQRAAATPTTDNSTTTPSCVVPLVVAPAGGPAPAARDIRLPS